MTAPLPSSYVILRHFQVADARPTYFVIHKCTLQGPVLTSSTPMTVEFNSLYPTTHAPPPNPRMISKTMTQSYRIIVQDHHCANLYSHRCGSLSSYSPLKSTIFFVGHPLPPVAYITFPDHRRPASDRWGATYCHAHDSARRPCKSNGARERHPVSSSSESRRPLFPLVS